MRYVRHKARNAQCRGVPVEGLCIHSIMDHPRWNNSRHCPSGQMHANIEHGERWMDLELAKVLHDEAALFASLLNRPAMIAAE